MKTIKELLGLPEAKKMKGEDPCWKGYEMIGTKKKNGKEVPNCVPKNEEVEGVAEASDKLKGTPVVSLDDLDDKDNTKDKYSRTVPKKLKKDDKRVQFLKSKDQKVSEELELEEGSMASQWRSGAKSIKKGCVELVRGQGVHTIKKDGKEIGDFSLDDDAGNWVVNWNKKKPGRGQGVHDKIDDIVAAALEEEVEIYEAKVGDTVSFHHELKAAPGTKMKKSGTVEKVQGDDVLVKVKDKYGVKRHQVKMSDLVKENFGADFLAMARQKNPNARLVTPDQKKKEAEELAKKRAGLKPAHAAPTGNSRPLGGHDPKSNRSYSEEVEQVDELNKDTVYSYNKKSTADTEKLHKKLGELIRSNKASEANKTAHKLNKRVAGQERADARLNTEEAKVETAAQVTKHFEMGQSTSSGVPKWVAEPLKKKKKKVEEAGDPELMGGAVSKPTASGNNPKLADKFMKAFRKMKSPANISCKTVGMISTCEEEEKDLDQLFTEAMKKDREETSTKKVIKKGEQLSGKQEPVKINPEIQRNQIGR